MYVCALLDAARLPQTMPFASGEGELVWCGLQILSVSSSIAEISFLLRREISRLFFFFSVAIVVLAFPAALARLYLNRDLSDATRFLMLYAGGGSVGVGMTNDDDEDGGGGVVVLIRCFLLILARRGDNNADDDNGDGDGGGGL